MRMLTSMMGTLGNRGDGIIRTIASVRFALSLRIKHLMLLSTQYALDILNALIHKEHIICSRYYVRKGHINHGDAFVHKDVLHVIVACVTELCMAIRLFLFTK